MMPGWVAVMASVCQAILAFLTLRARDPIAKPLALLSADLLAWNAAQTAYVATGEPLFHLIDITASPFTPVLGLHFVLLFVGKRRALGRLLGGAYAYFGALSATSAVGFFRASREALIPIAPWSLLFLAGTLAAACVCAWLLLEHHRESANVEERSRTRLLLFALPLAAAFGMTDLVQLVVPAVPALSPLGILSCALLMTLVTLRRNLFGAPPSMGSSMQLAAIAAVAAFGAAIMLQALSASTAMLLVGSVTLAFVVAVMTGELASARTARRARLAELALLGRMAAQMAHDLKNPLAAIKGAADFLREERRRGRSIDDQGEFLDLLVDESARLGRLIDDYQRLTRIEPNRVAFDIGELVEEVIAGVSVSTPGITARAKLDESLLCIADRDLLAQALDNVVRNAIESMPEAGTLTIGVAPTEEGGVRLFVEDTGMGMDARTAERAFDDFFTTKTSGTGLGLPFVRRVTEAHDGSVALSSRLGHGTIVSIYLPHARIRAAGKGLGCEQHRDV